MEELIRKVEELLTGNDMSLVKETLDSILSLQEEPSLYTHYLLSRYHLKQEEYDIAMSHLAQICDSEENPAYLPFAYKMLIYCYIKKTQYSKAQDLLEQIEEEFYLDADMKNMLAFIFFQKQNIDQALEIYTELLELEPDNITAQNGLASVYTDFQHQPEKALEILKDYQGQDPRILDTIGWAYLKLGNLDKAKEYLNQALDIMPSHPEINRHLTILVSHSE